MSLVRSNMVGTSILTYFCLFFLEFFSSLLIAAQEPKEPSDIALDSILKATLQNNGQIKESVQDIEIARAQLEQARAAMYPQGGVLVIGAPMYKQTGNAMASTSDWSVWGPYINTRIQLVQPLYSFGQISSYRKAAEGQIEARAQLSNVKKDEILYMAKEMYYGFLMANEFDQLLDDLIVYLDEAVQSAEKKKGQGKNAVKPHDVYKLKTSLDDLKQKKLYAVQARQTAEKAVGWVSGLSFDKLMKRSLLPEEFEKQTLDAYLAIAKENRPEFKALNAGKHARSALRDAKRAQSYPIFFVGAIADLNWSPVSERQQSNFAFDQFNRMQVGAGVGLKWDLEFKRHSAEAQEQAAELAKLEATEIYALPGIELQVKKAYWEMDQAHQALEIAKNRRAMAKRWFTSNAMGWSIGVTTPKDLMEALEGNGLARKNYIETIYSLNIALAKLTQAIGKEVTGLSYR